MALAAETKAELVPLPLEGALIELHFNQKLSEVCRDVSLPNHSETAVSRELAEEVYRCGRIIMVWFVNGE